MIGHHVACQTFWILKGGFVPPFLGYADYHAFWTLMVVLNHVPLVQLSYPVEGAYSYPFQGANSCPVVGENSYPFQGANTVPWEFLCE